LQAMMAAGFEQTQLWSENTNFLNIQSYSVLLKRKKSGGIRGKLLHDIVLKRVEIGAELQKTTKRIWWETPML